MNIADAVKQLRQALGLSQQGLADRLSMGISTVQRWEGAMFEPSRQGLWELYALAEQCNRPDLVTVFTVFLDEGKGNIGSKPGLPLIGEALLTIDDFFAKAALGLTKCISDPRLTNDQRAALIGEALNTVMEGRQLIARLLQDATERPAPR